MKYISFSDYFDKYSEDFEEEFLEEVEEGKYMNSDEDFFEFMSYKFESSIGDYEDQKYDEMRDERCGLWKIKQMSLAKIWWLPH